MILNTPFGYINEQRGADVHYWTEWRVCSGTVGAAVKRAIDRRAMRTRKALHDALMLLILRKGYEATTVQDIIDEANVGRSTFYAHYTGKEDLLRKGFDTLRSELAAARHNASTGEGGASRNRLVFSRTLFEHAGEYKHVYRALVGGRGGLVALSEIRRVLSEFVQQELAASHKDAAVPRELLVQFVVSAFLAVLTWWLERRPKLTPSQADLLFRGLVVNGIGKMTTADG